MNYSPHCWEKEMKKTLGDCVERDTEKEKKKTLDDCDNPD
jgi:hypothetical protein